MRREISLKLHVKNGVKNGKFHANFTLLGRSADSLLLEGVSVPDVCLARQNQTCKKYPMAFSYLGPAKTYILRGTLQTYAIKTRAVSDN